MNSIPDNNLKALPTVGHYQLIECVGRGGMGLVYSARDPRLGRDVAIKCLRTELFEPHYRERFRREALLLAKLNHPHIVHIYDFIETDDQLALVMELIDGQNLQVHLREHVVPISQRMQWLIQIAQGLAIAHDAGIIHRDLKAENVLINKHKQAKISDLGIAKSQDFNATLTDHVAGSYCSMSPEQAVGEKLDFKSDLFSFGILAYQLLCGAHPFGETENKLQIMQRIISHPPIPPTKHNPNLPPEICALLGQLLSKNPEKRPDNTHWVAAQLEHLSPLVAETAFEVDDTQLVADKNGKKPSGRTTKVKYTSHPTFETRYVASGSVGRSFNEFLQEYKALIVVALVFIVVTGGITAWLLQPKPPKYVAVIPPTLTAEGMQESQQELVKGAVYDAIQQSIIQLDRHYLIPRTEISEVLGDIETVRRATAADELITSEIQCKAGACTIALSRLAPENNDGRLRVEDTRRFDVLTDNYVSAAEIVQNNIGGIYSETLAPTLQKIKENDYASLLTIHAEYHQSGTTHELLARLRDLNKNVLMMSATQTLYTEMALDLFYEIGNDETLHDIKRHIYPGTSKSSKTAYLYNLFYLQVAEKDFLAATATIDQIKQLNASSSSINELLAHQKLAQQDYQSAIDFYEKSIAVKATAKKLYYLSLAFWYSGNTEEAKSNLDASLGLSPNLFKSHELYGAIALVEGDTTRAIEAFEQAIALKPGDLPTISNLGVSYLLNKKYTEAVRLFEQTLVLAPDNSVLTFNLADAEGLADNEARANELYQKLIDTINTQNADANDWMLVAQAHAHLGDFASALTALQKLERLDAQNINTTYTASVIHTLANNRASAILNIENSLKNGMNKIWFNFPWFDSLCQDIKFVELMSNHGEHNRCAPHETNLIAQ